LNVFVVDVPMILVTVAGEPAWQGTDSVSFPIHFRIVSRCNRKGLIEVNRTSWEEEPGLFRSFDPKG